MVSANEEGERPLFDLDNTKPYEKGWLIAAVGVSNEDGDSAVQGWLKDGPLVA